MSWARAFDWDGHGYGCASYAAAKVDSLRRSTSKRSDRVRLRAFDPVLAVHDLDQSAAWFCRVLGCERSDPDPGNWAFCAAGAVTFMLGRCPEALPASSLGDHTYVAYLRVDDVDDFYARALAEDAEVLKPPTDEPWGQREMGLRSPDGYRFMLGQSLRPQA